VQGSGQAVALSGRLGAELAWFCLELGMRRGRAPRYLSPRPSALPPTRSPRATIPQAPRPPRGWTQSRKDCCVNLRTRHCALAVQGTVVSSSSECFFRPPAAFHNLLQPSTAGEGRGAGEGALAPRLACTSFIATTVTRRAILTWGTSLSIGVFCRESRTREGQQAAQPGQPGQQQQGRHRAVSRSHSSSRATHATWSLCLVSQPAPGPVAVSCADERITACASHLSK
jgi:hypothetical protein